MIISFSDCLILKKGDSFGKQIFIDEISDQNMVREKGLTALRFAFEVKPAR